MKRLWYIKDSKGVASILTSPAEADESLARHTQYISRTRGFGKILTKLVPLADWEAEKVTIHTIEGYDW
jgi:hypothetical protein